MISGYQRVSGSQGLYKNPSTGTVINTDVEEILRARKRKENLVEEERRKEIVEKEVSSLKEEILELKEMLRELLGK